MENSSKTYKTTRRTGLAAAFFIGFGILFIIFMILIFLIAMVLPPGGKGSMFPGFFGGMSVIPIFSIGYGIFLLSSVIRVQINAEGVWLEGFISKKSIPWGKIARLKREKVRANLFSNKETDILVLCDDNDKELGRVSGIIDDFADLVGEIEKRSSESRGASTFNLESEISRKQQEEIRKRKKLKWVFIVIVGMFLTFTGYGAYEYYYHHKLQNEGKIIEAEIVRHYMYNVTPRLEYCFTTSDGKKHHNDVMMETPDWNNLEKQQKVKVCFLEDLPEYNCLSVGEIPATDPWEFLMVGLGGTVFFGIFLGIVCSGYDVVSKNGKIKLRKVGDIAEDLELEPTTVSAEKKDVSEEIEEPQPVSDEVPKGIKAITFLNVIWGLLCIGLAIIRALMSLFMADYLVLFFGLLDGFCGVLLIISAIGIYQLRSWGRYLTMAASVFLVISGVLSIIVKIVDIFQLDENMESQQRMIFSTAIIGTIIFSAIGSAYPVVILFIMGRKSTKEIFETANLSGNQD
jgi:hypothetical protein